VWKQKAAPIGREWLTKEGKKERQEDGADGDNRGRTATHLKGWCKTRKPRRNLKTRMCGIEKKGTQNAEGQNDDGCSF